MIVVNLFAGPGSGKSTTAAAVFALLKMHDIRAELVTEYAKDLTWEDRKLTLEDQDYVWAKQYHRIWRIGEQADVIITDSPPIMGALYHADRSLTNHMLQRHFSFENMNFYIRRVKQFHQYGRAHTKQQAVELDTAIQAFINKHMKFKAIEGTINAPNIIVQDIMLKFGVDQIYRIEEMKLGE